MKLKDAFEMTVEYTGQINPIKVNEEGMICLNDMSSFFPSKTMDNWLTKKSTKEFLVVIEKFLKPLDSTGLKLDDFGKRGSIPKGLESIKTKRGKYGGGTYAHELVALEFATWLSPEFKLNVLLAYQNGTQRKENWNIKRILSSFNYKIMSQAVEQDHEDPKHYHYSNEARMLNTIVFGKHEKNIREISSEYELDLLSSLESHNATLIYLGMDFKERKLKLADIHHKENLSSMNKRIALD